jgi:hypothetical protein
MNTPRLLCAVAAAAAVPSYGFAGDVVVAPLLTEGDPVAAVGAVTLINNLAIDNAGSWFAEVDTDNADTGIDGALLLDGVLLLREGDSVGSPAGALLSSFDSISPNDSGQVSYNLFLDGTTGTGDDSGVYVDLGSGLQLIFQESNLAPTFSAGTPWLGFFETRLNDAQQLLVLGTVSDPLITTGSVDEGLLLIQLDGAGAILSTTRIAAEGDSILGVDGVIDDLEDGSHELALNDLGQVLWAGSTTGAAATDAFVALDAIPVAIEGGASPVAGRNWSSLASPELDLNNLGQYVLSGTLDGDAATNTLIEKSGQKFRQEGDAVPVAGLESFLLTGFGTGPVLINDRGEVLWFGDWDAATDDTGLFLDDELLLQEGDVVGGLTVAIIRGIQDGYAMSDDGSQIVVEVSYEGNIDGLVRITREGTVNTVVACFTNDGLLSALPAAPAVGDSITLTMDGSPYPLALVRVFLSGGTFGSPCGLFLPGIGEVILDLSFFPSLTMPNYVGAPSVDTFPIPDSNALIGTTLYFQGLFADLSGLDPQPLRVSNGLAVCFGL